MFCASIVYPADLPWFDSSYFASHHLPMFADALGDNCVHWEVHLGLGGPGAPPLPFTAAAYVWVRSATEFGQSIQDHSDELYSDIPNFSPVQPSRGWAQVETSWPVPQPPQ